MTLRSFILLLALMCAGMLASGQLYIALPIADALARHFGVPEASASLVGTTFGMAYAAGFLVWGPVSDRVSRQVVLVGGVIAMSLATFCVALAPSFHMELATRVLQGVCAASIPPAGLALVSEVLSVRWRPIGVAMMSFSFIASAPIAQFYARATGLEFQTLMLIGGGTYALCAIVVIVAGRGLTQANSPSREPVSTSLASLARDPVVLTAWAISLTILFGFVAFQTALHTTLDTRGWSETALRGLTLLGMLTSFAAGFIIRSLGAIRTAQLGFSLVALALVAACASSGLLIPSILVLSIGLALSLPSIISIVSQRATHASRGLAISIYSFALFLGASLAPIFVRHVTANTVSLLLPPVALLLISVASLGLPWIRRSRR